MTNNINLAFQQTSDLYNAKNLAADHFQINNKINHHHSCFPNNSTSQLLSPALNINTALPSRPLSEPTNISTTKPQNEPTVKSESQIRNNKPKNQKRKSRYKTFNRALIPNKIVYITHFAFPSQVYAAKLGGRLQEFEQQNCEPAYVLDQPFNNHPEPDTGASSSPSWISRFFDKLFSFRARPKDTCPQPAYNPLTIPTIKYKHELEYGQQLALWEEAVLQQQEINRLKKSKNSLSPSLLLPSPPLLPTREHQELTRIQVFDALMFRLKIKVYLFNFFKSRFGYIILAGVAGIIWCIFWPFQFIWNISVQSQEQFNSSIGFGRLKDFRNVESLEGFAGGKNSLIATTKWDQLWLLVPIISIASMIVFCLVMVIWWCNRQLRIVASESPEFDLLFEREPKFRCKSNNVQGCDISTWTFLKHGYQLETCDLEDVELER